jgi:hypothetical protein
LPRALNQDSSPVKSGRPATHKFASAVALSRKYTVDCAETEKEESGKGENFYIQIFTVSKKERK